MKRLMQEALLSFGQKMCEEPDAMNPFEQPDLRPLEGIPDMKVPPLPDAFGV